MTNTFTYSTVRNDFWSLASLFNPFEKLRMDIDLTRLSLHDLNLLLTGAEKELQVALLNGQPWSELKDLRDDITEIRIAIHRAGAGAADFRFTISDLRLKG